MAFGAVAIEYHAFYPPELRFDHHCHNISFSEEAQRMLYFLMRYGIKTTIVTRMYGDPVETIGCSSVREFLHQPLRRVSHTETMLQEILEQTGLRPCDVLYVDDILHPLKVAKQTGVATCGLTNGLSGGKRIQRAKPTWLAGSFSDVAAIAHSQLQQY